MKFLILIIAVALSAPTYEVPTTDIQAPTSEQKAIPLAQKAIPPAQKDTPLAQKSEECKKPALPKSEPQVLSQKELPKIDYPKIDYPKVDYPKIDVSKTRAPITDVLPTALKQEKDCDKKPADSLKSLGDKQNDKKENEPKVEAKEQKKEEDKKAIETETKSEEDDTYAPNSVTNSAFGVHFSALLFTLLSILIN